ncbi:hypothetical protein OROHE_026445 [Orobanche hederae]
MSSVFELVIKERLNSIPMGSGMNLLKMIIVCGLFITAICGFCKASIYKVGDDAGWDIMGDGVYKEWALSKIFKIGDTIVFEYDPGFHSVLQVSQSNFYSCNTATPVSTYTTGNDSIVVNNSGHYYYICGVMGHCEAGQQVEIVVTDSHKPAIEPVSSPVDAPSQIAVPKALSDSPVTPSNGESFMLNNGLFSSNVGLLIILLSAVI